MSRTRFIDHGGRRIVFMDFSQLEEPDLALVEIAAARQFVAAQPKVQNLLTLVFVEGSRFDGRIIEALRELATHDRPWVLAGAVVGMSALHKVLYRIVTSLSGRKLAVFSTIEEAKDWLVAQPEPPAGA